jgi:hypothetical protein
MSGDADRPHTRTAAAVRDAEGLVEVQVTDVGTEVTRARESDHRVHVRAVEIDLAAVLVDDATALDDPLLEDAVRRRIGHHQRGQLPRVLLRLRAKVADVDVAMLVGLHDDDLHPRHDGARRIRSVRGLRNQADVAVAITARLMVFANDEQTRILALRPGVRLKRDGREPGDLGQRPLQVVE